MNIKTLENRLQDVAGIKIKLNVRKNLTASIYFEGENKEAVKKLAAFFDQALIGDYDVECDDTVVELKLVK